MIIFNEIELKHIKQMIEEIEDFDFEGFEGSKDSMEAVLKNFDSVNEDEKINSLLLEALDEFYAWYWFRGYRYNLTIEEMCKEMAEDKIFNEIDVSIFRKIYSK